MFSIRKLVKAPKNKKELNYLFRKYYDGIVWLVSKYNRLVFLLGRKGISSKFPELEEIRQRSRTPTDISDHLETIFTESLQVQPNLIVELGVGPGQSTFVFERVAKLSGSSFVSVDVRSETSRATLWSGWFFVERDDVEFAGEFRQWAQGKGINPLIDVLFIDTSHTYDHTVKEIKAWFPMLSDKAKVFFHDTNARTIYWHRNRAVGLGYDIQRAVIRAIEESLNMRFNEGEDFEDIYQGWFVKHYAICNGLTILSRVKN